MTYRESADWNLLSLEEEAGGGYDGVSRNWLCMTARKEAK